MLFLYLNGTERSADIEEGSLTINNQLQQRTDTCNFLIFQGTQPSENQEVRVFMGDTIAAAVGATITLNGKFERVTEKFYPGQVLYIRISDADEEKVIVDTYDEATLTLVLVSAPSGTVSAGDKIGELIFGGVVSRVADQNDGALDQIDYTVTCVDYLKLFNKKRVSDTWLDATSRYIINSFLNSSTNFNRTIDDMSYDSSGDLQTEWIESSDGTNPTRNSSTFMEGDSSAQFGWTFAGGTAIFTRTLGSPIDVSELVGATTGMPTKGQFMCWANPASLSAQSVITVRLGSASGHYLEITLPSLTTAADFNYLFKNLTTGTVTGTPNWQSYQYIQIRITETASSNIKFNGMRINGAGAFTMVNTGTTVEFEEYRAPQLLPSNIVDTLAKAYQYVWYINYERDIVFAESDLTTAPINFSDTSNNFTELSVEVDQSQLGNRIVVNGGERVSSSTYAQVIEGDNARREWLMKTKFKNLALTIDNNTSTDTMEATTTTTTVKATAHGLSVGDHITNRTRSNAVRQVLTVPDADTFTVEAVTSQASGDTFSKYDLAKTIGVEGLTDETTVDYVANSNEKSVRACASEPTYNTAIFLRFEYNERVPLTLQYSDSASQNALKALGLGDGIFDLDPITDRNITDTITALTLAQAKVNQYSNALVSGRIKTDRHGVRAGTLINLNDSNRAINSQFLVQTVRWRFRGGAYKDYVIYDISFGTTLFGVIEFYQKLLRGQGGIELNEDAEVTEYVAPNEEVGCSDSNVFAPNEEASNTEEVSASDSNALYEVTDWHWEASVGQPVPTRWDLFDWG